MQNRDKPILVEIRNHNVHILGRIREYHKSLRWFTTGRADHVRRICSGIDSVIVDAGIADILHVNLNIVPCMGVGEYDGSLVINGINRYLLGSVNS